MPNLIAPELAMIKTMDNRTGYVIYRKYGAYSRKGVRNSDGTFAMDGVGGRQRMNVGGTMPPFDTLRGTFSNGAPQSEYTSRKVSVKGNIVADTSSTDATGDAMPIILKWSPVLKGSVKVQIVKNDVALAPIYDDGNGGFVTYSADDQVIEYFGKNGMLVREHTGVATPYADAHIVYGTTRDDHFDVNGTAAGHPEKCWGAISLDATDFNFDKSNTFEVDYEYENDYVPQNDIPLIGCSVDSLTLTAKPRRIAIYYSQLAEFEANKDYNYNLSDDLKKQAEFQLQYKYNCTLAT